MGHGNPNVIAFWDQARDMVSYLKETMHNEYIADLSPRFYSIMQDLRVKTGTSYWAENFTNQYWNGVIVEQLVDPWQVIFDHVGFHSIAVGNGLSDLENWSYAVNRPVLMNINDNDALISYVKDCWNDKLDYDNSFYDNDIRWGDPWTG